MTEVICNLSVNVNERELLQICLIPLPIVKQFAQFLLDRESSESFDCILEDGTIVSIPFEELHLRIVDDAPKVKAYKDLIRSNDIRVPNYPLTDHIGAKLRTDYSNEPTVRPYLKWFSDLS